MPFDQKTVDRALRGDRSERRILRDDKVKGLLLQIGTISAVWLFQYRRRGLNPATGKQWAPTALRIGDVTTHALGEARAAAARLRASVLAGNDPGLERHARVAAAQANAKQARPAEEVLPLYAAALADRQKGERHTKEELAQTRLALSSVGALRKPLAEVARSTVLAMLDACPQRSRRARFGALDRFLRWCVSRGHIESAVTASVDRAERAGAPASRDRVLSLRELALVWRATNEIDVEDSIKALLRFLIAVPARRSEASGARFEQFAGDTWHQSSTVTKNKVAHDVPLPQTARDIIARQRERTGGEGLLFPAPKSGDVYRGFSKIKVRLDEKMAELNGKPIAPWRFHDLRRTFATQCAEHGVDETVVDLLLNHVASGSRGGVKGVYQRSARWADKVAAMEAWQRVLDRCSS